MKDENVIALDNATDDQQHAANCFALMQQAQIPIGEMHKATKTLNWLRSIIKGDLVVVHKPEPVPDDANQTAG